MGTLGGIGNTGTCQTLLGPDLGTNLTLVEHSHFHRPARRRTQRARGLR